MPKRNVPSHPTAGLSDYLEGLQVLVLQEPDRIVGVLGRAYADAMLERLLYEFLVRDKLAEGLLKNGDMASFSGRITLAHALGWLPKPVYSDLQAIREIGNYFAHHLEVTTFDESPVADWCENFWAARVKPISQFGPKGRPGRARDLYNTSMVMVALELEHTRTHLRQCRIPEPYSQHYREGQS